MSEYTEFMVSLPSIVYLTEEIEHLHETLASPAIIQHNEALLRHWHCRRLLLRQQGPLLLYNVLSLHVLNATELVILAALLR